MKQRPRVPVTEVKEPGPCRACRDAVSQVSGLCRTCARAAHTFNAGEWKMIHAMTLPEASAKLLERRRTLERLGVL